MGFELSCLISAPLAPVARARVTRDLLANFRFLRLPTAATDVHPERIVLGGVERTSYMLHREHEQLLAQLYDEALRDQVQALSEGLPGLALAWVHTDCFGGRCDDEGLWARDGVLTSCSSLVETLAGVGLETSGPFAGFERDHFGAQLDPEPFARRLGLAVGLEVLGVIAEDEAAVAQLRPPSERSEPGHTSGPLSSSEGAFVLGSPLRLRQAIEEHVAARDPGLWSLDLQRTPWADSGPEAEAPVVFVRVEAEVHEHGARAEEAWLLSAAAPTREVAALAGELLGLILAANCRRFRWVVAEALAPGRGAELSEEIRAELSRRTGDAFEFELEVIDAEGLAARFGEDASLTPLWLGRTLARSHAPDPFEAELIATLDSRGAEDEATWAVLADRLVSRGDPRGQALALDLRARGLPPGPERSELEAEARRRSLGCWSAFEQAWLVAAEPGQVVDFDGGFAPRLWWSRLGPFVTRVVVEPGWRSKGGAPALGSWRPDPWSPAELGPVAAMLGLGCARYLGPQRVSLVGVASPQVELEGHDLGGFDLGALSLELRALAGARFDDACVRHLRRSDLRGASFQRADLREADLRRAGLVGADLRHASLAGADLQYADLRGAALDGANFVGADLRGADLRGARLSGATWTEAKLGGARVDPDALEALPAGCADVLDLDPRAGSSSRILEPDP